MCVWGGGGTMALNKPAARAKMNHETCLVKSIVETFVQVFQVQQNDSLSRFHAHFDTIDVCADLKTILTEKQLSVRDFFPFLK